MVGIHSEEGRSSREATLLPAECLASFEAGSTPIARMTSHARRGHAFTHAVERRPSTDEGRGPTRRTLAAGGRHAPPPRRRAPYPRMKSPTPSDAVMSPPGRHASCACRRGVYGAKTWLVPAEERSPPVVRRGSHTWATQRTRQSMRIFRPGERHPARGRTSSPVRKNEIDRPYAERPSPLWGASSDECRASSTRTSNVYRPYDARYWSGRTCSSRWRTCIGPRCALMPAVGCTTSDDRSRTSPE